MNNHFFSILTKDQNFNTNHLLLLYKYFKKGLARLSDSLMFRCFKQLNQSVSIYEKMRDVTKNLSVFYNFQLINIFHSSLSLRKLIDSQNYNDPLRVRHMRNGTTGVGPTIDAHSDQQFSTR